MGRVPCVQAENKTFRVDIFSKFLKIKKFFSSREFKIFLTFFLTYTFFIQWFSGHAWNENSRLDITRAIVEEHRFEIDSYCNNIISFTGDRAYFSGHYYSDKAPGLSFLATPIYAFFRLIISLSQLDHYGSPQLLLFEKILVTMFTSSLLSALTVVLVYKISKYTLNENQRLLLTISYGLGTFALWSATTFQGHAPATFFLFASFYLVFKMKKEKNYGSSKHFFLAGLLAGFAVVTDYLAGVFVLGILVMVTVNFRINDKLFKFILGCFLGILPLLAYNYAIFRNPLELTLFHLDPLYWRLPEGVSSKQSDLLRSVVPDVPIMVRMLIFPERGLLFYNPILILAIIGLYYMHKEYKFETHLMVWSLLFLMWFSSRQMWWGGSSFGPRYLFMITPFLMVPLSFMLKKTRIYLFFMIISMFINFLGLQLPENLFIAWSRALQLPTHNLLLETPEYWAKMHSFQILGNPITDYYFPLFMERGPNILIFVGLYLILLYVWTPRIFKYASDLRKRKSV